MTAPLTELETRRLIAALVDKHLSVPRGVAAVYDPDQLIYNIVATTVMDTLLVVEGTVPIERYEQPSADITRSFVGEPPPAEVICVLELIDYTRGRSGKSLTGRKRERAIEQMARDLDERCVPYIRDGVRHARCAECGARFTRVTECPMCHHGGR